MTLLRCLMSGFCYMVVGMTIAVAGGWGFWAGFGLAIALTLGVAFSAQTAIEAHEYCRHRKE